MNGTPPYNGTTVAGGNGPGSNSNQLFSPTDVWVLEKTGNIYIADSGNHRITLWRPNATSGVTIAGDISGTPGSNALRLALPYIFTINANETRMYVSDLGNQRVQLLLSSEHRHLISIVHVDAVFLLHSNKISEEKTRFIRHEP
jgi:hypothetical protein